MPAVSTSQRRAAAIAEHHPEQLSAKNRGLLGMNQRQLSEFASGSEKGLPHTAGNHPHQNLGKFLHPKNGGLSRRMKTMRSGGAFRPVPRGTSRR